MSDHQITDLLERATAGVHSDTADLVAGGVARGRRRRRLHLVGTALATAALVGVGGSAAVVLSTAGGTSVDATAADPSTPTPSATPTPTPPADAGPRRFGMDPAKTGLVLGSLLDGTVTKVRAWHEGRDDSDPFRGGSVLLDGAQVTILLQHQKLDRCGEQPPGGACDSVGEGFMASFSAEEPVHGVEHSGIFTNSVTLYTADDFAITATALNAPKEKYVDPVMDRPVLTVEQLQALVQEPVWLEDQQ